MYKNDLFFKNYFFINIFIIITKILIYNDIKAKKYTTNE